ncbi:MAG TPA: MATE family efflux transporter, partial [Acetobacteraceae bacterium]|nr:MATE family efflux transporter [Acetobacteraceae bacterium]
AGRREDASALVLHALLIAVAGGLLFALLLGGAPHTVFGPIGGPAAAAAAAPYAVLLFGVGAVPTWLANTFASVLRGAGQHALVSRMLVITTLAYPPLAWALVEKLGMGLPGVGLAMALTQIAATAAQGWAVAAGKAGFRPVLRLKLRAALFGRILSVGLVACIMATIANLATILVTARIAAHGAAAVAAYGVSARLEFLMIPLAFGVGSALTALVGRAVGAGDWETARRTAWTGAALSLAVTGAVGFFVALFPGATARAFASDPEVVAIATTALSVVGPALPGFGVGMAFYFAAMGAGRMRWPVAAGLSRIGLAVGGGWLLSDMVGMGLPGQFLAVALGITAYGVLCAVAVRPEVWPGRG